MPRPPSNRPHISVCLAATLAAVVCLAPSAARAEQRPPRVVVLSAEYAGDMPSTLRERIDAELLEALGARAIDVVSPGAVATALAPLGPSLSSSCRAGQCVRWILDILDADGGLVSGVSALETSYTVTLVMLGPDGDELDRVERRCDICTYEELEDSVRAGVGQLDVTVPRRLRAGRVGVVPAPSDARVVVDGVAVGTGSVSVPVTVGTHRVGARREGYLPVDREVVVEPEQTTRVDLRLTPGEPPPPPAPAPRRRDPRLWLWTSLGTGAAVATAGGVLYGLGASCVAVGPDGACERESDLGPVGAGLLGGGLAAAVVSAIALTILSLTAP